MGRSSGGANHSTGGTTGGGRSSGGFSGGGRLSASSRNSSVQSTYGRSESRNEPTMSRGTERTPTHSRVHRPYRSRPYRRGYYSRRSYGRGCSSGCSTIFVLIIIIIIIYAVVSANLRRSSGNNYYGQTSTQQFISTKSRKPLKGVVKKTDYYSDQIGWIKDKSKLQDGLKEFYNKTGVQPYVLFVKYSSVYWNERELDTTSADSYLEKVYKETFSDEGHMIFAYFQCDDDSRDEMEGTFRYLLGYSAQTVMDEEAINIFLGYLDQYYADTNLSLEKMISETFESTANSIM